MTVKFGSKGADLAPGRADLAPEQADLAPGGLIWLRGELIWSRDWIIKRVTWGQSRAWALPPYPRPRLGSSPSL